jgi:hypothetical protein
MNEIFNSKGNQSWNVGAYVYAAAQDISLMGFHWTHRLFGMFSAKDSITGPLFSSHHGLDSVTVLLSLRQFRAAPCGRRHILVVLAVAIPAFYIYRLANQRWIYVAGAVAALYFNLRRGRAGVPSCRTCNRWHGAISRRSSSRRQSCW